MDNPIKRLTKRAGYFFGDAWTENVLVRGKRLGPAYFENANDYKDYADALEKLAQYEDAEEQGNLIICPCKVGDMVYYKKGPYIYGDTVKRIVLDGIDNQIIIDGNRAFMFCDFNIRVFSTREDAEAALMKQDARP